MTTPWQPGYQGVTVVPPGYTDPHSWSPAAALQLVASTGIAGFALQNGTPGILSWTAPNDNQLHTILVMSAQQVTSPETGGAVSLNSPLPDGNTQTNVAFAGGSAAGDTQFNQQRLVKPGGTVSLAQSSALTAGAATVWATIWAS